MFKRGVPCLVGVDVTCSGVNLLELSLRQGQYCITGLYQEAFEPYSNQVDESWLTDAVSGCIRRAVMTGAIRGKQAVVAVPDSVVITKVLLVHTGLTPRETEELIGMECKQSIPYPMDEMHIDFQITGPSKIDASQHEVLVVFSRKDTVTARVEMVTRAKLAVEIVDVESFAMQRAVQWLIEKGALDNVLSGLHESCLGIIHVGVLLTHLLVMRGNTIVFTQEIGWGSQADSGILMLHIRRMVQLYFSSNPSSRIDCLMLAGVGAGNPGLASWMQENLAIPTVRADPLGYFNVAPTCNAALIRDSSTSMMMACGLALRGLCGVD